MRRSTWVSKLLVLPLLIGVPAAAQQKAAPADVAAVRAAIEGVNAQWAAAAMRGDAAAIAAQYTEDAIIMGPGAPAATGRAVIQAGVAEMPAILEPRLTMAEVEVLGTTAIERGTFHMKFAMPGQAPLTDDGKYIVIWKRGSDGTWLRHREIFNSDLPAPPVRAAPGDSVFVVLNHVKPEMRAEFERQANEVFLGAWRKLAETEPVYRAVVPAVRMLEPIRPDEDGSYTYVVLIDPLRPGADYGARSVLSRLHPAEKVAELLQAWTATLSRPQEAYRVVQK